MTSRSDSLSALHPLHQDAGVAVVTACETELFPCDALCLAVLDRSLSLLKGFETLIDSGNFPSGMALVRMQLDSVLRLYGVITSGDAHEIASRVLSGEHLRKIKNRQREKMTDEYLKHRLGQTMPWIPEVYDRCSGYIHLSSTHVQYFLSRCPRDKDGRIEFTIGDQDDHVPSAAKDTLVDAFVGTTKGVCRLVTQWSEVRQTHGQNSDLKRKYKKAA